MKIAIEIIGILIFGSFVVYWTVRLGSAAYYRSKKEYMHYFALKKDIDRRTGDRRESNP